MKENLTKVILKTILSTIGWNLKLKNRKLSMDIQKPFEIVKNGYTEINIISNWLEPIKTLVNKEQASILSPACSVLRTGRDSNPRPLP